MIAWWKASLVMGWGFFLTSLGHAATMDEQFQKLSQDYIKAFPAFSPVTATQLGDHRFDDQLDDVSKVGRKKELDFCQEYLESLKELDRDQLSRDHQVDYSLLSHRLQKRIWEIETLQEWAWNPLVYTEIAGSSIYGLMARDFAPVKDRLEHVAHRLNALPKFLEHVRQELEPQRVPRIHAETAVKQNRGMLSILNNLVRPEMKSLTDEQRTKLEQALKTAEDTIETHQTWLEETLVPNAGGEFRLGARLYDEKLRWTLGTPLTRGDILRLAKSEIKRVRGEMYDLAVQVYKEKHPLTSFPKLPSPEYRQAIIRAALEEAARQIPRADGVVAAAENSMEIATEFVKKKNLISLPDRPLEIIIMPEFQRGVSVAYCDSPGPLESGEKTFYAVAPLPEDWSPEQATSFLREYNLRSIHNLTVHEAMPGHFVQLAAANEYPSLLRAVCSSGTFIEGWACYTEQMMSEEGFLDEKAL